MTATSFSEIPRGVLAGLLDMCGNPAEMSPRRLMGEAETVNPVQIAQLYGGGYLSRARMGRDALSPLFKQAANVLLDPRTNLTFRIWGAEELCAETNIQFPGNIENGHGVMLLPVSGSYRMSAFVEPEDIVTDLSRALPPGDGGLVSPFNFEASFDAAAAAVLFALIDLHRAATGHRKAVAAHEIFGYLNGQWGLTGFNQLTTYVQAAGMQSRPPSIIEVELALAKLEAMEAVSKASGDHYRIADELRPLVDLTRSLASGLQWERVSRQDIGEIVVSNRIFVYGDGGLTISFIPTVKGRLFVQTVAQSSVIDFVIDEISGLSDIRVEEATAPAAPAEPQPVAHAAPQPAPRPAAPPPPKMKAPGDGPAASPPPSAAARSRPGAEASTASGDAADALTCPSCGAAIKEGQKFCTSCGSKIVFELAGSACPSCGKAVKPGAKFCTHCGQKL